MLAQSATAALYLQTRTRRQERLARQNNNTHNVKNRNSKNIEVCWHYSAQTQKTYHNTDTTSYYNIKETFLKWHQSISRQGSPQTSDPSGFQESSNLPELHPKSSLQELRQPCSLHKSQQPCNLKEPQQLDSLHESQQSSNFQQCLQLSSQRVLPPSCIQASQRPCIIHESQQASVTYVSQESSVPYVSQEPGVSFLTQLTSRPQLSQVNSKLTAWSERCWKAESWKLNNWKSLEWIKSKTLTTEWLRDNDIGDLLKKSKDWGSEWLECEWEKAKNLEMPRVPIGDWMGLSDKIQEGIEMKPITYARVQRRCVPAVVVYDSGVCTKEEDDPANAVLYFRPRHTPTTARTSLAGQLAGVVHFCRHAFATPTIVRTRHAHIALKDYGRFVVMVCGRGGEWARARLLEVTRLLDASTGGLPHLWLTCGYDHQVFTDRLTELLDALLPQALPDADFGEDQPLGSSCSTSPSTPSPATEASEGGGVPVEGGGSSRKEEEDEEGEEEAFKLLHRIFNAVPSVQLPKSGGGVFLRAQQLVEVCQQQPGVLAGATMHKDRVLNSQMNSDLAHVLASIPLHKQKSGVLEEREVEYQLPGGVQLLKLHVPKETHSTLRAHLPKSMPRRGERGLHSEAASMDLASLRSVLLSRQSLHTYPSTLPTTQETSLERCSSPQESQKFRQNAPRGPSLMARISGCSDLEGRPSQSLPGSPRKIRVAATLPDVGGNSPDLRYKVLTGRKPRPPASSHSTPRRMPGGRNGLSRNNDANNGLNMASKRGYGMGVPGQPRYNVDKRNTPNNKLLNNSSDVAKPILKNGTVTLYDSEKSESGFEDGVQSDSELNIKNTKNKLNLQFAPDKINRPSHEIELDGLSNDEPKITREINGNLSKDYDSNGKDSPNGNLTTLKSQMMDFKDESDTSRSEESDISVLDLSTFIETKENGDRQLAEAVRGLMELTTRDDDQDNTMQGQSIDNHLMESGQHDGRGSAEGWELLTLYTQKHSDTVLHLLLSPAAPKTPQLIYSLWRLGLSGLEDVQAAIERAMEVSEGGDGGDSFLQWSYSVLSAVTPSALDMKLVATAHQDFKHHQGLMEVTLRSGEAVLWGHRHSNTQTFYQVNAAPRPGLPIPSDIMAKVPHRARRRLDRDHNITLL
nr:uncharacterized protein LOC128689160 [Cherax quadricarinatus]XP_053633274.1 uncharacterized protein LOC128689160 [Cherax quadricarinatus]